MMYMGRLSKYVQRVGRHLDDSVRTRKGACQFSMLTLMVGKQGVRKSNNFRKLEVAVVGSPVYVDRLHRRVPEAC